MTQFLQIINTKTIEYNIIDPERYMGKRQAKIFIITKKKKNCIKSKGDFLSYYKDKETLLLLSTYGKEFINAEIKKENKPNVKSVQYKALAKLTVDNEMRNIALKWIYTIITDNKMDINVYYITVSIFDRYLSIKGENDFDKEMIKKIIFTSFVIASKYDNGNDYSMLIESDISSLEIDIYTSLHFDISFFSSYNYIKAFFADFKLHNSKQINYMVSLEKISIAISKLITLEVSFYNYSQSVLAIGCLIKALDFIATKSRKIKTSQLMLMKQWINLIIATNYKYCNNELIVKVINKIQMYWNISDFYIVSEDELAINE